MEVKDQTSRSLVFFSYLENVSSLLTELRVDVLPSITNVFPQELTGHGIKWFPSYHLQSLGERSLSLPLQQEHTALVEGLYGALGREKEECHVRQPG